MQRFILFYLLLLAVLRAGAQNIVWISPCTDTTFCFDPGSCSGGTVVLWEEAVTTCSSPKINYSYKIDLDVNGSIDIQSTEDTLNMVLPAGTHEIIWRANDNCGNISQGCSYRITVKDCSPPNLLCVSGLTQNLLSPDCITTFDVQKFILAVGDNCTPKSLLEYGIRRPGTGTGFPPDTSLTFEKCEQGQYAVQVWARDTNGLANSCNSYVVVQDNTGLCPCEQTAGIFLQGCSRSADSVLLDEYSIRTTLAGMPLQGAPIGDTLDVHSQDSCFNADFWDLPLNGAYTGTVRATRSGNNPLLGVSTFDLVLINRHILGQQPLENFYQVLAADVNRSNTISTFDIIEIRKLILGIYDTFPQVPSWRFIRPVPDPLNLVAFAEVRDTYAFAVQNLIADTLFPNLNFVGIKMGDVNANATFHDPWTEDRGTPLLLLPDDRVLEAGQEHWVALRVSENVVLDGWQLALQTDLDRLKVLDVRGVPPQSVAMLPSGELRISCLPDAPEMFSAGDVLFEVLVSANALVRVSEVLRLGREPLAPEAYPTTGQGLRPIGLELGLQGLNLKVQPPNPNPFSGQTVFSMDLDEPCTVRLELFDLAGKVVFGDTRPFSVGQHEWVLSARALPGSGVYAYRLSAGAAVWSGRVVRL